MSNKFMFLFLLFFVNIAWTQINPFSVTNSNLAMTMNAISLDDKSNKVEGSPYISNEFFPSKLSCFSGATPPIRYNTFKEEMEFMADGKLYYLNKNENCELTINNNTYKYFINYDNKKNNGFLIIFNKTNDSKYIYYKKEKVIYISEYIPNSSYGQATPARFEIDKSKYFIKIQDSLVEFPNKKSELLKLFPNYKDQLELFLKENKIKFSEEPSLLLLMNYLNTL